MEILVIDPFKNSSPHFKEVGLVTAYKSVIWDVQLYGLGEFDLVVPATDENLNLLKIDRFLCRAEDVQSGPIYKNVMIIRNIDIEWNPDEGYMMHITGKSLKDILNQRIIWFQITATDVELTELIADIIYQNIVDPVQYVHDMIAELTTEVNDAQQAALDAETAYDEAVAQYGEDSDEAKEAKKAMEEAETYAERMTNRWENAVEDEDNQTGRAIPYFNQFMIWPSGITEPEFEEIQLHGEQIGNWMEKICTEYGFGWELEIASDSIGIQAIVGTNLSSTVIFSPDYDNLVNAITRFSTDNYHNGGQVGGEGEGLDQIKVKIGNKTGYNLYELYINGQGVSQNAGDIPKSKYKKMLKQYGNTEIQRYIQWKFVEGSINPDGMFKMGVDYTIGDIVKIDPQKGVTGNFRLVEIIDSEDASGTQTVGTFEEVN